MAEHLAQRTGILLFRALGRKIVRHVRDRRNALTKQKTEISDEAFLRRRPSDTSHQSSNHGRDENYISKEDMKYRKVSYNNVEEDSGYDSCRSNYSSGTSSNDGSSFGEGTSCRESDNSADTNNKRETHSKRRNLSHVTNLTRVLENLRLHLIRKKAPKQSKSILRRPVRYVYMRGISGLPTRRVPVSTAYYRQPRPGACFYR